MRIGGLDFETANTHPGSICAAGFAIIENETLIESREWFVKPHHDCDYFYKKFVAIHGITYFDVRESPRFPEIWSQLSDLIDSVDIIVAHNAAFDIRMLKGVLDLYSLPEPEFDYLCTLKMSRREFPKLPRHNLAAVSDHLHISLNHHDALSDAEAAARIASYILNNNQQKNLICCFRDH